MGFNPETVVFRGWEVELVRWAWGQIVPTLRANEDAWVYSVGIGEPREGQYYKMIDESGKVLRLEKEKRPGNQLEALGEKS